MAASSATPVSDPQFKWHQTALRIKDPKVSIPFYEKNFGMKLLYKFTGGDESHYYLASVRDSDSVPAPDSAEANEYLLNTPYVTLELWHKHGVENDPNVKYDSGNNEPKRGFGHIAFLTKDVYEASAKLEADGVKFRKRPDEGRMKGLAFAEDPDGYWIEIVKRAEDAGFPELFNLGQTMFRVKDAQKSIGFYRDTLGMSLINELHFDESKGDFSLYYLATLPKEAASTLPPPDSEAGAQFMKRWWHPVIELTHNHGTEKQADFRYHNAQTDPKGFSHIGFTVPELSSALSLLKETGATVAHDDTCGGINRRVAYVEDPDGYWVELTPIPK